jgi:hypothetical protein
MNSKDFLPVTESNSLGNRNNPSPFEITAA